MSCETWTPRAPSHTKVMNGYRSITAPTAPWYAEGDARLIELLLQPVQFIGKRRASGLGRVTGLGSGARQA